MAAVAVEFKYLIGMGTWKLVPRPKGRKVIKRKWVLNVKRKVDKSVVRLKARFVAMGYTQVKGEDFDEVFSPTLCMENLHLIFTILAKLNWVGSQIDFKTAFLNGSLDDVVYMEKAPGFEAPGHPYWDINQSTV